MSEEYIKKEDLIRKLKAWDCNVHGIPNYAWRVINELPTYSIEKNAVPFDEVPFDIELFQAGLMDIPKGMTNEEVIKALFPDLEACSADSGVVEYANTAINIMASRKWLDSPYQKGDE